VSALHAIIAAENARDTFPAAKAFGDELRRRYGDAVAGVVFYGSCLRQSTDMGLMLDFYVLVDSYRAALKNPVSAFFAALLPPNVYYHEMTFEGRTLRAKVAVISMSQFMRNTGAACFASSTWARFAQPALILFARNDEVRRRITAALAAAPETLLRRTAPLLPATFTARDLWVEALTQTYGAELRPEAASKGAELVDADLARYAAVTSAVFGTPDANGLYHQTITRAEESASRKAWALRRVQGKTLNALRLIKAAFTFQGGLDYAVWKIERHSGVKINLTDDQRKRPIITGLKLFLQTRKRGGIK